MSDTLCISPPLSWYQWSGRCRRTYIRTFSRVFPGCRWGDSWMVSQPTSSQIRKIVAPRTKPVCLGDLDHLLPGNQPPGCLSSGIDRAPFQQQRNMKKYGQSEIKDQNVTNAMRYLNMRTVQLLPPQTQWLGLGSKNRAGIFI